MNLDLNFFKKECFLQFVSIRTLWGVFIDTFFYIDAKGKKKKELTVDHYMRNTYRKLQV